MIAGRSDEEIREGHQFDFVIIISTMISFRHLVAIRPDRTITRTRHHLNEKIPNFLSSYAKIERTDCENVS